MRTATVIAIITGVWLSAGESALAQSTPSTRGTTSSASSLGIGSSMFGTASGGSAGSGFGGSGFGSSTGGFGGQSGFGQAGGQSGFGQSGFGQSGFGQAGQRQQGGVGNTGFLGANTNGSFIGRNTQGQTGNLQNFGNQNRGGNNRGGGQNQNQNLLNLLGGGMGGMGNQGGQTSTRPVIRPRQKVAFDFPQPSPDKIQTTVQTQLTGISRRFPQFQNVQLTPGEAGEVVLTGSVPSARDARLAANLARLEPGVRSIRNELEFPPEPEGE